MTHKENNDSIHPSSANPSIGSLAGSLPDPLLEDNSLVSDDNHASLAELAHTSGDVNAGQRCDNRFQKALPYVDPSIHLLIGICLCLDFSFDDLISHQYSSIATSVSCGLLALSALSQFYIDIKNSFGDTEIQSGKVMHQVRVILYSAIWTYSFADAAKNTSNAAISRQHYFSLISIVIMMVDFNYTTLKCCQNSIDDGESYEEFSFGSDTQYSGFGSAEEGKYDALDPESNRSIASDGHHENNKERLIKNFDRYSDHATRCKGLFLSLILIGTLIDVRHDTQIHTVSNGINIAAACSYIMMALLEIYCVSLNCTSVQLYDFSHYSRSVGSFFDSIHDISTSGIYSSPVQEALRRSFALISETEDATKKVDLHLCRTLASNTVDDEAILRNHVLIDALRSDSSEIMLPYPPPREEHKMG